MEASLLKLGTEVRQALHHIQGLIELTTEEPLSDTQMEYLEGCREAADRLRRTADDLIELSQPPTPIPTASFDLTEAIEEVTQVMGTLAERKSLSFHCKLESGLPGRVLTDKYLLQDILRRILDNAIRFASSGSVYMQAGCSNPDGEGLELTFEISDAGSGISQETWDSIEAPLNELQIQGLSLRIVRRRLEALGGSIALVPTRPEGTGVVLRMPVLVGAGNSEKPAAPVHGSAKAPLKILLAEDSHDSFLLFKSYVKTEGHEVVRAMDGLEAFEMVQRDEFDYIVMDVNMPRMDGYSATRLIREWETDQGRARLPILLLSADDLERQGRLGGAAGCSGFLQKPTNKTRVLAALNYYLPNEAAQGGGRLASA